MKPILRLAAGAAALAAALAGPAAHAHVPVCKCHLEGQKVICQGGYDDDSRAVNTPIRVIDYNEKVLVSGKLDARSRFVFDLPEGDFYILMDDGIGHTAEVERVDIRGI